MPIVATNLFDIFIVSRRHLRKQKSKGSATNIDDTMKAADIYLYVAPTHQFVAGDCEISIERHNYNAFRQFTQIRDISKMAMSKTPKRVLSISEITNYKECPV